MHRFFKGRFELFSTIATFLHFLFGTWVILDVALFTATYVFGVPHGLDAERVALMGLPAIGAMVFFDALRMRLLQQPCRTKYGVVDPLEPGWATCANAQVFAGALCFAFVLVVCFSK